MTFPYGSVEVTNGDANPQQSRDQKFTLWIGITVGIALGATLALARIESGHAATTLPAVTHQLPSVTTSGSTFVPRAGVLRPSSVTPSIPQSSAAVALTANRMDERYSSDARAFNQRQSSSKATSWLEWVGLGSFVFAAFQAGSALGRRKPAQPAMAMMATTGEACGPEALSAPPLYFDHRFLFSPLGVEHQQLAIDNPHPRDSMLTFDEGPHTYRYETCDGNKIQASISCTGLVESCFPKFEADKAIQRMMNSAKWPTEKYTDPETGQGYTPEQIKQQWEDHRVETANRGTWMHHNIERVINGLPPEDDLPELGLFREFQEQVLGLLRIEPYRTEFRLFDEELDLAGSIDFIGVDPQGRYHLCDWKRSSDFLNKGTAVWAPDLGGRWPLNHLPNSTAMHYALQLNLYSHILEHTYGIRVSSMWLGVFHPDQPQPIASGIPFLRNEVACLLALRRLEVQQARKAGEYPECDARHAFASLHLHDDPYVAEFQAAHAVMVAHQASFYQASEGDRARLLKQRVKEVLRFHTFPGEGQPA